MVSNDRIPWIFMIAGLILGVITVKINKSEGAS